MIHFGFTLFPCKKLLSHLVFIRWKQLISNQWDMDSFLLNLLFAHPHSNHIYFYPSMGDIFAYTRRARCAHYGNKHQAIKLVNQHTFNNYYSVSCQYILLSWLRRSKHWKKKKFRLLIPVVIRVFCHYFYYTKCLAGLR